MNFFKNLTVGLRFCRSAAGWGLIWAGFIPWRTFIIPGRDGIKHKQTL